MRSFKQSVGIYPRPETIDDSNVDSRHSQIEDGTLNDDSCVPAYKVPWESYGHLSSADDAVEDAVWGMQEGRRQVRQLKKIKETY